MRFSQVLFCLSQQYEHYQSVLVGAYIFLAFFYQIVKQTLELTDTMAVNLHNHFMLLIILLETHMVIPSTFFYTQVLVLPHFAYFPPHCLLFISHFFHQYSIVFLLLLYSLNFLCSFGIISGEYILLFLTFLLCFLTSFFKN